MSNPVITLAIDTHRDKAVVSLRFAKDFKIINKVKSIKGVSWSQSRKFWYISKDDFKLSEVLDKLSSVALLDCSAIEKENTDTQKQPWLLDKRFQIDTWPSTTRIILKENAL